VSRFPFSDALDAGRVRLHSGRTFPYISFTAFDDYAQVSALTTLRNSEWPAPTTGPQLLAAAGSSVARTLQLPHQNIIAGKQVHGTNIFSFSREHPADLPLAQPMILDSTDGLLTDVPGVALVVVTADCLPIFLFDPKTKAVGLLHSGRAGSAADMVGKGIRRMTDEFDTQPTDCIAVIGPSVGPCCYDVNLWQANETRLIELGVSLVSNCRICTKCNSDLFYSYRAERERAGRMISAIALK
jgi:YfiH family protein